jgi:signal transduction histidine kinase
VTVTARAGELRVADTGPGLAVEDLPRAFERFYLHGRYATNRAVGTGLGLAIVKELIEAMNGSVTVESTVGHGTTFVVSLPAAAAGRPTRPATAAGGATQPEA